MNLFDTNSTSNTQIISISSPQEFIAFGLVAGDSITVEIAYLGQSAPAFIASGCSFISTVSPAFQVEATVPYTVCGCVVGATSANPRFIIDRPGVYVVTFTGPSFGDAIVQVADADPSVVEQFKMCPCPSTGASTDVKVVSIAFGIDGLLTLVNSDGSTLTAQIPICP